VGVSWRRAAALAGAIVAAVATACVDRPRVAADDQAQLAAGERTVDSLVAIAPADDVGAVALGYVERLRLGLGSPFRLAEQAASDARLPGGLGRQVAWGLLARTARGDAFVLDPEALADDPAPLYGVVADGEWHRAAIDSMIAAAGTARSGEEAVRIGYALARAEGLVSATTANAAVHAAALARDRRLAIEDATRLLAASRQQQTYDALDLVPMWRDARRLRAEMPLMADALAPDPAVAVREAERLLARIRQTSAGLHFAMADTAVSPAPAPGDSVTPGVLVPQDSAPAVVVPVAPAARVVDGIPVDAARRLAGLPSVRGAYPVAPIVVTMGGYRQAEVADSLQDERAPDFEQRVRMRLVARATTDERLAAEWALARAALPAGGAARRELAALVQAAAVSVRPWAQTPVDPATPTDSAAADEQAQALQLRDGLRAIEFERGMPAAWRPIAARQLGGAVADLRGVFPT
jgi:hypothetical protein